MMPFSMTLLNCGFFPLFKVIYLTNLLIGGKLIPLSKFPKPGVRPIVVGDAWRRMVMHFFTRHLVHAFHAVFQSFHPNVRQFCAAARNGQQNLVSLIRILDGDHASDASTETLKMLLIRSPWLSLGSNSTRYLVSRGS